MGRDIERLPAGQAESSATPGGEGASALIAQLFRQVLRLQPRNERSTRLPLPEGDETARHEPPPIDTRLAHEPPPPPGLSQRTDAAPWNLQATRPRDATRAEASRDVPNVSGAEGRTGARRQVLPVQPAEGLAPDQAEHRAANDALQQLAQNLQRLCERGSQVSQHWSATLELDPQALPETLLRVQASRGWMRLRFSTQSGTSVRLISDHAPELRRSLEESLDMKDQVDIDFE